jgi:hypothetical protein
VIPAALLLQECRQLQAWLREASQRPAVQASCVSGKPGLSYHNFLIWVYQRYANASALSTSAADFKD